MVTSGDLVDSWLCADVNEPDPARAKVGQSVRVSTNMEAKVMDVSAINRHGIEYRS